MRLRIIIITIGAIVVGTVAAAFAAGGDSRPADRSSVVAAFYPLAYAAEQVGGAHIQVTNLTPAGVEPHDLELSPDDVATVKSAGTVLLMGHGFQPQLERAAADSNARVVTLLDTPGLGRVGNDPHVLARSRSATRSSCARSATALHGDPAARSSPGCTPSTASTGPGSRTAPAARSSPAMPLSGIWPRRYGLRQIAVEGLSPEAEPAPRELARVVARRPRQRRDDGLRRAARVAAGRPDGRTRDRNDGFRRLDPLEGLTPQRGRPRRRLLHGHAREPRRARARARMPLAVELDGVTFGYDPRRPVLVGRRRRDPRGPVRRDRRPERRRQDDASRG